MSDSTDDLSGDNVFIDFVGRLAPTLECPLKEQEQDIPIDRDDASKEIEE